MTHDLDQLRAVLRDRAALAPSADDLLPRTRRLAHRQQVRRRIGLVAGVVVGTVLALVGADMFGTQLPRDTAINQPKQPDRPDQPLVPPMLPFTVGLLPDGLQLMDWTITGDDATHQPLAWPLTQYTGRHESVAFSMVAFDPAVGPAAGTRRTVVVHGTTVTIDDDSAEHGWGMSWPAGPGHWMSISVAGDAASNPDLISIAGAVIATPSAVATELRLPRLPLGFTVFSWASGGPQTGRADLFPEESVRLCADLVPPTSHAADCITVLVGTGKLATARALNGQHLTLGRQYDGGHWIGVYAPGADPAVLNNILREASLG